MQPMFGRGDASLQLRPMRDYDIDTAVRIIEEYDSDDAAEANETYASGLDGQYCLCERGQVVGVIGAKPIENTDGSFGLSWTYLSQSQRRTGKGSQMLQWMIEIVREQDGRKLFVHSSDYVDPEHGDVYRDARDLYLKSGFIQELRHNDFYAPGEAMIVYGMRLQPKQTSDVVLVMDEIRLTDVDEINETRDAFWIAWELAGPGEGTKPQDFEKVYRSVREWGGRCVYMAFPSDVAYANNLMSSARFRTAGKLYDYYQDGVDEIHYRYDLSLSEA